MHPSPRSRADSAAASLIIAQARAAFALTPDLYSAAGLGRSDHLPRTAGTVVVPVGLGAPVELRLPREWAAR